MFFSTKFCCFIFLAATSLFFFILPSHSSAARSEEEIDIITFIEAKLKSRAARIQQTVNKCCPSQQNGNNITQPIYCCQEGLFPPKNGQNEAHPPLRECTFEGYMDEEQIVKAVRCAQQNMHGHQAANICQIQCCELFFNLEPKNETTCSRHCVALMQMADTTRQKLLHSLRKMQCNRIAPIHYKAFSHCIKQIGTDNGGSNGPEADIDGSAPPCSGTAASNFDE